MAVLDAEHDHGAVSASAWLLYVVFALYCLASLASLLGGQWWGFEVFTHFRPQLVLAGAALAIALSMVPRAVAALIAAAFAGIHLVPVLPYYLDSPAMPGRAAEASAETSAQLPPGSGRGLRLAVLNLQNGNGNRVKVLRLLLDFRPDIALVTEFTEPPLALFGDLGDVLPHRVGSPVAGTHELLVMSRHPIRSVRWHYPSGPALPVLEAEICPPDGCLTVIALHAIWPFARRGARQAAMFATVAARAARRADGRVVVMGDLNATPYAPSFAALLKAGRLVDGARGHRRRPTWLTRVPLLGLAIDHVLLGGAFVARDARVLPGFGADHFPLLVDIVTAGNRPSIALGQARDRVPDPAPTDLPRLSLP